MTKNKGTNEWKEFLQATIISILRHKKIKAEANTHDSEWYAYFEKRKSNNPSLCENDKIWLTLALVRNLMCPNISMKPLPVLEKRPRWTRAV